ncbi:MAG: diversity-generating retroelement protein Avd [Candidatus Desulforudaceae bacterium]
MDDLKILQKTYDMLQYGYTCLRQYPKSEKHTLAAETKRAMLGLLRAIIKANKRHHKQAAIQDADVELETLRHFIRLGHDLGFLPLVKYEHWARMTTEIGKMIGGWLKVSR